MEIQVSKPMFTVTHVQLRNRSESESPIQKEIKLNNSGTKLLINCCDFLSLRSGGLGSCPLNLKFYISHAKTERVSAHCVLKHLGKYPAERELNNCLSGLQSWKSRQTGSWLCLWLPVADPVNEPESLPHSCLPPPTG